MRFYWGAVDWGYWPSPGVFQVWGMDEEGKIYRVAEVYRTKKQQEWWSEVAQELHNEFKLRRIVCDPEEPERIKTFNDRLSFYRDRTVRKIAVKAENPIMTGIDMVRWGLNPKSVPDLQVGSEREGPQLFLVKGALRYGVDENLKSELRPTSLEQEIVSFVWDESTADDTKVSKDRPDPKCADHALDCMRYAAMYAWKKDRVRRKKEPRFKPGTFGHFFNHEQILGKRRPD
jgi:hypothetical protein